VKNFSLIATLLACPGLLIAAEPHLAAQQPAPLQVIAITGAKLLTVSHGTIENGVLVRSWSTAKA